MNFSALIGIFSAVVMIILVVFSSTSTPKVFLDYHAFLIVIGGTLSASLIAFSGSKLFNLVKVFISRILAKDNHFSIAVEEIVNLAKGYRESENYLQEVHNTLKTPFLKEAIMMMLEGGIEPNELDKILYKRALSIQQRHEEDAEIFKTISKFPPAFGLLGAVIGMISLMQSLGGADAFQKVGPAMAVALVATMYGIAMANFVFLPLGENLAKLNRKDHLVRLMVLDGIKMIRQKKHPILVFESVKSYLLPGERDKLEKVA